MENQNVSESAANLFRQGLARLGLDDAGFSLIPGAGELSLHKEGVPLHSFPSPVKMGTVIYFIQRLSSRSGLENLPEQINIGPYVFEARKSRLVKDGNSLQLTDKERDILVALWQADGHALVRDELLKQVWAYADGVETHTLETHIYRLRQKMEEDPASPRWLLNSDGMYRLNA